MTTTTLDQTPAMLHLSAVHRGATDKVVAGIDCTVFADGPLDLDTSQWPILGTQISPPFVTYQAQTFTGWLDATT